MIHISVLPHPYFWFDACLVGMVYGIVYDKSLPDPNIQIFRWRVMGQFVTDKLYFRLFFAIVFDCVVYDL